MKKAILAILAIFLATSAAWAAEPVMEKSKGMEKGKMIHMEKGKEVTITGRISCTFCNLPAAMECTKECCTACIKAGDPVLFSDEKGNLYLLVSGEKEKPLMTPERMNLISEKVKIQGMLVTRGGIQGIYVKTMEKAM
jgi:hypothetical protein